MKRIVIIGAGGFAREVRWLLEELNAEQPQYDFAGYVISDLSQVGPRDSAGEIVGDLRWLAAARADVDAAVFGIGSPEPKLRLTKELKTWGWLEWPALVHPSVIRHRSAHVADGALVCAGSILSVNATIEEFAMVSLACTVGHETTIGAAAVINPGCHISGGVRISEGVMIGTGAKILQYLEVGSGSIVGAGSVVLSSVPSGVTVAGIPARRITPVVQAEQHKN